MITQELADSLAGLLFPRKLWVLANSQEVESVKWGKQGTTVLINSVLVEKECFKPNVFNVQSNQHVLRQMSYYNFQKIDRKCKIWEFKHEHFQAGREDLLHLVKRQPQGVPKKYIDDIERRHSSRLQRQSSDRPNYARMERGTLVDSDEVEPECRPNTRSSSKKRAYHRRSSETPRGSSTRGRGGSRRGVGRGRRRTTPIRDESSFLMKSENCDTQDGTADAMKELEYIVPSENWVYCPLQNGMDDKNFPVPAEEDDKSHLKYVVESTERAMMMDARLQQQQESSLVKEWGGCYATRMMNSSWSSPPDALSYVDGRYPPTSEGNEAYGSNGYPVFSTPLQSGCMPYGNNFHQRMMNFDLTPFQHQQYSSSSTMHQQPLPPFSEFHQGVEEQNQLDIGTADDKEKGLADYVTLDHNYNTIKGAFNTLESLEAEYDPLENSFQSVLHNNDNLLDQLIEEQMDEPNPSRSPSLTNVSPTSVPDTPQQTHPSSNYLEHPNNYHHHRNNGDREVSNFVNDFFIPSQHHPHHQPEDAKTVAYFLLDSNKYKKYNFAVTDLGDIVIKDCGDDFLYWKVKKDVTPQTLITSPCLQVE